MAEIRCVSFTYYVVYQQFETAEVFVDMTVCISVMCNKYYRFYKARTV